MILNWSFCKMVLFYWTQLYLYIQVMCLNLLAAHASVFEYSKPISIPSATPPTPPTLAASPSPPPGALSVHPKQWRQPCASSCGNQQIKCCVAAISCYTCFCILLRSCAATRPKNKSIALHVGALGCRVWLIFVNLLNKVSVVFVFPSCF